MEVTRIQIRSICRPNLNEQQELFIDTINRCPLCGAKLQFTHQSDNYLKIIKESAQCASCGISTRTQSFKIQ